VPFFVLEQAFVGLMFIKSTGLRHFWAGTALAYKKA